MPHRQHRNANAAPTVPRRKKGRARRADWIIGTLVELDPDGQQLTIRVREGRGARISQDAEVTLDVGGAVLKATDGDGDGRPGITDLFPGDVLHVRLAPAVDGRPPAAVRISQASPGGPAGGLRRLWSGWRAERG